MQHKKIACADKFEDISTTPPIDMAASVPTIDDECSICLSNDTSVSSCKFTCGCIVKVHSNCIKSWFSDPKSGCVYCRKPTSQILEIKLQKPFVPNPLALKVLSPPPFATQQKVKRYLTTQDKIEYLLLGINKFGVLYE